MCLVWQKQKRVCKIVMADTLTRCSTCLGCNLQELYNPKKKNCANYKSSEVSNERVCSTSYHQATIGQVTDSRGREDTYILCNVLRAEDR